MASTPGMRHFGPVNADATQTAPPAGAPTCHNGRSTPMVGQGYSCNRAQKECPKFSVTPGMTAYEEEQAFAAKA